MNIKLNIILCVTTTVGWGLYGIKQLEFIYATYQTKQALVVAEEWKQNYNEMKEINDRNEKNIRECYKWVQKEIKCQVISTGMQSPLSFKKMPH